MSSSAEAFDPIVISTLSGLGSAGDTISRKGHIDIDEFHIGGHDFKLPQGLDYDIAVTNTGEGFLATGIVSGQADTVCDRCLGPATVDIAGEVSCYYMKELPEQDDDDDDEYGLLSPEGDIDVSEAVQSAVAMDLPYVVLCKEDCKGLCPTCGCNLNYETCDCAEKKEREVDPSNPFAALAGLVIEKNDEDDD